MSSGNVTVTTGAVWIPEEWDEGILDYKERRLRIATNLTDASLLVPEIMAKGDTIHVPRATERTAQTKEANTTLNYTADTDDETTIVINQDIYDAQRVENIVRLLSSPTLMESKMMTMGYALAKNFEAFLAALIQSATANDVALTTDNTMSFALFQAGQAKFMDLGYDAAEMAESGDINFYGNSTLYNTGIALGEFTDTDKSGVSPSINVTGRRLIMLGIAAFNSTDWSKDGTTGVEAGSLFARNAVSYVMRQNSSMVDIQWQQEHKAWGLMVSQLYGASLTFPAAGTEGPIVNFTNP